MPELPEVEVVRAGLEPAVAGSTVTSVEVVDERALTRHDAAGGSFESRLSGRTVKAAVRRGKFLWMPLAAPEGRPPDALVAHLGMSGQLLLRDVDAPASRSLRIRLVVENPRHGELAVHFVDQRTFGSMAIDRLVETADAAPGGHGSALPLVPGQVAHIARDPLDPAFDDDGFIRRLLARTSTVKRALLDQSLISGVGNIYADEALWAARVHFDQPTSALSVKRAERLLAEVRQVLAKALAEGGTSFDAQYVNVNGQAGYFAHSLNAYGRTGQPCPRCGRPIVRARFMNRSSHYCSHCQRIRRAPGKPTTP
jgi:formamidopyrimidine-DNA glycosylase